MTTSPGPLQSPNRVLLSPAARLLWRAPDVVELQLGARSVLLEGVDSDRLDWLLPARSGDPGDEPAPGGDPGAHHALDTLTAAGYLWPADAGAARLVPERPRLAADLEALAARHGHHAPRVLAARRRAAVTIDGANRVAASVAALLAAAGVGRVCPVATEPTRLHQAMPGGVGPDDEGQPFCAAAESAVHRAAPEASTTALPVGDRPDLVVLAGDEPVDPDHRETLHARGQPHLPVRLGADFGVVGPLVIPGVTSCLRCADLHRRDRDPAWDALAVQLSVPRRRGAASDVAVAAVMAGQAALQALTFLDGGEPAAVDATLELHLPDWRLRRRSWPVHAECGCQLPSAP